LLSFQSALSVSIVPPRPIISITVMVLRSTPSLLSQSTTSTAVAPCDDADKDYDLVLADMMSNYGMCSLNADTIARCPSKEEAQRQKRRSVFTSFRGSQKAAPEMVQEEEEGGEEAASAADEGDAKKPARKEGRWSLKPMFRRSQ
jgi:hypothetical protein